MKQTYQIEVSSPPALDWETYEAHVNSLLGELLESGVCDEASYQALFEQHPSLLPWSYGTFGGGHHGLIHGSVAKQPRLAGLYGRQPDLMYLARDTGNVYAVLVELESPCKRWFTRKGHARKELTEAIAQLRSWKRWFELPGNEARFRQEFQLPEDFLSTRKRFLRKFYLIYGRRKELVESGYADLRSQHEAGDEHFISYDHLAPQVEHRNTLTAVVDDEGYHAVAVPPTIRLGPSIAGDHARVKDKERALEKNALITAERKAFLLERWSYWDAWGRNGRTGIIKSGDWE